MVYESDFYTTRRPYRATPSVSSYTITTVVPSKQIRILPGIGKVHVVHSYDRIIPYIGHKRLTVVPTHVPHVFRVRPSVIVREIDRITHKPRPYLYYTPSLVHSEPLTYFDDEARLIRAQTKTLLRTIHTPVPRVHVPWPLAKLRYHYELPLPIRITSDEYIHRMLTPIKSVKSDIYNISHYITEPIRRHLGPTHLACVRYAGDKAYSRRRNLTLQEIYAMQSDAVRNDIQLLSYYIKANKERKALEGPAKASAALDALRPSRHFSKPPLMLEPSMTEELKELREARAERLRKIQEIDAPSVDVEAAGAKIKRSTKKQEEERLAEERALAEEKAKKEAAAKREEEARRAEIARQAELERKAAEEKAAAEAAEQARLEAKKAAEEEARLEAEKAAAEKARIEAEEAAAEQARIEAEKAAAEQAKLDEERRLEEERQQLLRLEEIARQAEEEKERELARQAEELAELARQEAELAEQAKREAELAELAKQEAELAELERQEKELAELDRQEREAAEAAKEEAELEEQAKEQEEVAAAESNITADEDISAPEQIASEEEAITSEPENVASPEPNAEADITASETEADADPEPVIEEPETPEHVDAAQEDEE